MATERTFAMLKPGVLQKRLVGDVINRLEKNGFNIIALKLMTIPRSLAEEHYQEHKERPFFSSLIGYVTSGSVIAMILERENGIASLRKLAGATKPDEAAPGTIRGDLGITTEKNIIHASDSPESANREIELFFSTAEIHSFEDGNACWN